MKGAAILALGVVIILSYCPTLKAQTDSAGQFIMVSSGSASCFILDTSTERVYFVDFSQGIHYIGTLEGAFSLAKAELQSAIDSLQQEEHFINSLLNVKVDLFDIKPDSSQIWKTIEFIIRFRSWSPAYQKEADLRVIKREYPDIDTVKFIRIFGLKD